MAGNHHKHRKGHGNPPAVRNAPPPRAPTQPRAAATEDASSKQPPTGPRAMQVIPTPHPSFIQVAKPYVFEHTIQECLAATGVDLQREDNVRISGVTWIDNVRKALRLYVFSFPLSEISRQFANPMLVPSERIILRACITTSSGLFILTVNIIIWYVISSSAGQANFLSIPTSQQLN